MPLEFASLGRKLFAAPNIPWKKTPLVEQPAPEKCAGSSPADSPTPLSPLLAEWGQAVLDQIKTAVELLSEQLQEVNGFSPNGFSLNGHSAKPSLISVLASVPKAEQPIAPKAEQPVASQYNALSMMTQHSFNLSTISLGLALVGFLFKPLAVASLIFVVLGSPEIVRRAYTQLFKERRTTVDLLILATVAVGLGLGTGAILSGSPVFALALSLNIFLANYAQRLMRQVREDAKGSLVDVFKQQPSAAWVLIDGVEMETPVESLCAGDVVVVNAGETIPIDGRVIEGLASVDQHILTGEAQPAEKGPGDQAFALTLIATGKLWILVEKTGQETTAAQIGQILNQTMNFKTGMQLWAENVADQSVVPTLAVAALALPFVPGISWALLVAHPKYKGTVATYINILSYLDVISKHGILIKDGRVLELLNDVDTVVFDKTGTLTETQPHVGQVHAWADYDENEVLLYAAAAEYRQTHPVAIAILQEAESHKLPIPEIETAAYKVGYGLTVTVDRLTLRVGSLRFMQEEELTLPVEAETVIASAHQQGHSLILVAVDQQVVGALELVPTVRPEAQAIIQGLRKRGIKQTYIISGDHDAPTRKLAHDLGIDHYFAETLPEEKANLIEQLQQAGKTVCYIGDGINDAIALKKAAVSISLQGASSVAVDTAQVVLMDQSLNKLCELFDLAADFKRNMTKTFGLVVAPHILSLLGLLFLHFGLLSVIILCQLGLGIGVANALLPRLQHKPHDQHPVEDTVEDTSMAKSGKS